MHAAVVTVTVDESIDPERKMLREGIIPLVSSQPGFVTGYWLEPVDGHGLSFVIYDTEANARGGLDAMEIKPGATPGPGVVIDTTEVREVVGNA